MVIDNKTIKLLFICTVLVFVIHAVFLSAPAEDAFISFRFADNLANYGELTWNHGEPPVEGYTNFLWLIICSFAIRFGFDVILFSQLIGIIASILILLYVYSFCKKFLGLNKFLSLLPSLFLAFSGPFATWATSGMETNLFTLFVFSGTYHLASYWKSKKDKTFILSLLLILLATLTRPEGFLIFTVLMVFYFMISFKQKSSKIIFQSLLSVFLFYIIPFLIYFIWRYTYYNELLPLTYYAKTGGTVYQWIRGIMYSSYFCFHYLLPFAPILIILFWLKSDDISLSSLLSYIKPKSQLSIKQFSIALIFILCFAYSIYIVFVGGDYMAMYRFFVPILPFIYILITAGIEIILDDCKSSVRKTVITIALITLGIAGTVIHSTPIEKYFFSKPPITHGQYRGVLTERWHTNRLSLIGHFFNEYKSSEDESLATDAIGTISFYAKMKILGIHGLVDLFIAKMTEENLGKGLAGHEKLNLLYTLSKRPTYFMCSRELTKNPGEFPVLSNEVDNILQSEYKLVNKWLFDKANNEAGYFTFLKRKNKLIK